MRIITVSAKQFARAVLAASTISLDVCLAFRKTDCVVFAKNAKKNAVLKSNVPTISNIGSDQKTASFVAAPYLPFLRATLERDKSDEIRLELNDKNKSFEIDSPTFAIDSEFQEEGVSVPNPAGGDYELKCIDAEFAAQIADAARFLEKTTGNRELATHFVHVAVGDDLKAFATDGKTYFSEKSLERIADKTTRLALSPFEVDAIKRVASLYERFGFVVESDSKNVVFKNHWDAGGATLSFSIEDPGKYESFLSNAFEKIESVESPFATAILQKNDLAALIQLISKIEKTESKSFTVDKDEIVFFNNATGTIRVAVLSNAGNATFEAKIKDDKKLTNALEKMASKTVQIDFCPGKIVVEGRGENGLIVKAVSLADVQNFYTPN